MGTWSWGAFDNDYAMDWVRRLSPGNATDSIRVALTAILADRDHVEAPEAQVAVAAAELLAALAGQDGAPLPPPATCLMGTGQAPVDAKTVSMAVAAVDRIASRSELQQLWADSRHGREWAESMRSLRHRLSSSHMHTGH